MDSEILQLWPIVFVIADVVVPESVSPLLSALRGLKDDDCKATTEVWAIDALEDAELRIN